MSKLDETLDSLLQHGTLTFDQTRSAIDEVMNGDFVPAKLAAWLTALRMKGETSEEIAGCAAAMQGKARHVRTSRKDIVDIVGTGGDKSGTVNVSTAAAFVAAAAGAPVAKHGNRAASSLCGSADVLAALGIRIELTPEEMGLCLDKTGFTFMFAPMVHPAMRHAAPVRKEMGIRTVFNILGPLCNPAGARRAVIGVYEPRLCLLMAKAAASLGAERLFVVHGEDGLDEITITGTTRICELKDGLIDERIFDPRKYGVPTARLEDVRGGGADLNARLIINTFTGAKGSLRDFIILNTAATLIVAGKADDWASAINRAGKTIDSGAAMRKLEEVREFTQGLPRV